MKNITRIVLLFFITSCASSQNMVSIHFKRQKKDSLSDRGNYSMNIPQGYKLITLVGGHSELEKQYVYPDSAYIYISDFGNGGLNYKNIIQLGDSIANKRFENIELKTSLAKQLRQDYMPEKLVLQGQTSEGLYWKDIRIGYISVGYTNVTRNKKSEFDKALSSFNSN